MTLDDYLSQEDAKSIVDLARESGLSQTTLRLIRRGYKLRFFDKARALSEATEGQVSVEEICK